MTTKFDNNHPDAKLFPLIERFTRLDELSEAANDECEAAAERVERPSVPAALEATGDAYKMWPQPGETFADSARSYFHDLSILATAGGPKRYQKEARELADKHANEVIAAWNQWQADTRAAEEAAGLPAAERRLEESMAEWSKAAHRLAMTHAKTIDGLLAKLVALGRYYEDREELEAHLNPECVKADDILQSAIGDAKALAGCMTMEGIYGHEEEA